MNDCERRPVLREMPSVRWHLVLLGCLLTFESAARLSAAEQTPPQKPAIHVPQCKDFEVTGRGDAPQWKQTEWVALTKRANAKHDYSARFKMLYSPKGVYVLFDGSDKTLTATMTEDFLDLWNEDVFECFFWTDERHPIYFEYEISPLGYELPIIVPNLGGKYLGWRPWHYEGNRKTRKAVTSFGLPQTPKGEVAGWRAEVFFPCQLLEPLGNNPPKPGTRWRANFYRVDYDDKKVTAWDWARVGPSFHDYQKFGTIVFD